MHDGTPAVDHPYPSQAEAKTEAPKKHTLHFIAMPFIGLIACFSSAYFTAITTDIYVTEIAAYGRCWREEMFGYYSIIFYLPICLISPTLYSFKRVRFLMLAIPLWYPLEILNYCPLRSIHIIVSFLFGYAIIYAYENIDSLHSAKLLLLKTTQSLTLWAILCGCFLLITGNYTNLLAPAFVPDDQKVFILQIMGVMLPFSFFHIFQQQRTHRIATAAAFLIIAVFLSYGQTAPLTARPLPVVKKIKQNPCDVTITGGKINFIDPVISCGEAEIEANLKATIQADGTTKKAGRTTNFDEELSICVEGKDNTILRMCKTSSIRISNVEDRNFYLIWTSKY